MIIEQIYNKCYRFNGSYTYSLPLRTIVAITNEDPISEGQILTNSFSCEPKQFDVLTE
jgi:hypothetical protein